VISGFEKAHGLKFVRDYKIHIILWEVKNYMIHMFPS
jgi:hypothetical protein